jgi:hypothetical protein
VILFLHILYQSIFLYVIFLKLIFRWTLPIIIAIHGAAIIMRIHPVVAGIIIMANNIIVAVEGHRMGVDKSWFYHFYL